MKKSILILAALFLFNCTSDDSTPKNENILLGTWKVIESLADPGDGSGTFQPVTYNKTVEFFSDGTVAVNGDLCFIGTENNPSSGTFMLISSDETDINHDGEIKPNDCEFSEAKIYFDITSNNKLVLWYPCIEGCGEKFKKVK